MRRVISPPPHHHKNGLLLLFFLGFFLCSHRRLLVYFPGRYLPRGRSSAQAKKTFLHPPDFVDERIIDARNCVSRKKYDFKFVTVDFV
jgi:hypothetical protein